LNCGSHLLNGTRRRGLTNAEIGKRLHVRETTIRTHVAHLLEKLELRDRVQTVILAYEARLVGSG
jgi:DNA-binding NarL/FixJ family response regulator